MYICTYVYVGGVTSPYKYFDAAPTRTTCCKVRRWCYQSMKSILMHCTCVRASLAQRPDQCNARQQGPTYRITYVIQCTHSIGTMLKGSIMYHVFSVQCCEISRVVSCDVWPASPSPEGPPCLLPSLLFLLCVEPFFSNWSACCMDGRQTKSDKIHLWCMSQSDTNRTIRSS